MPLSIYIDGTQVISTIEKTNHYMNITSTGVSVSPSFTGSTWTYTGSNEFIGLSTTQGAMMPDQGYSVGSNTFINDTTYYFYTVTAGLLTVKYNNSTIYNTSEDGTFTLTTKGKYLPYDIEVNATIEAPLIEDTNAAATDILSGYTAYINNNQKITGSIPTFNGSITITRTISFTIWDESYNADEGMTWEEWINSEYNTINLRVESSYYVYGETIPKQGSTVWGVLSYNQYANIVEASDLIVENRVYWSTHQPI